MYKRQACAIAGGIRAEKLAFLTDVEGVCMNPNDPTTLVSVLNLIEANKLIEACLLYTSYDIREGCSEVCQWQGNESI